MTNDIDYDLLLLEQFRDKIGIRDDGDYPKSHWPDCSWGNPDSFGRVVLPKEAPARLISCNACLRRWGYIRVVVCNPRFPGWPSLERVHEQFDLHREAAVCEYTNCETWLRVSNAGEDVETVLRRLDKNAYHPVTWMDTGILPFHEKGTDTEDLHFTSKDALDQFCTDLVARYGESMLGAID